MWWLGQGEWMRKSKKQLYRWEQQAGVEAWSPPKDRGAGHWLQRRASVYQRLAGGWAEERAQVTVKKEGRGAALPQSREGWWELRGNVKEGTDNSLSGRSNFSFFHSLLWSFVLDQEHPIFSCVGITGWENRICTSSLYKPPATYICEESIQKMPCVQTQHPDDRLVSFIWLLQQHQRLWNHYLWVRLQGSSFPSPQASILHWEKHIDTQ